MKKLFALMLMVSLATPAAHAARRRAIAAPAADELTIVFATGDVLDVRDIVGGKVTRTIGVRLERRGGANKGVAVLRAWIEAPDPRCTLRVDGKRLGGAPVLIDPQAPLGATVGHRIEIDVPPTASAGAVLSAIRWEATTGE